MIELCGEPGCHRRRGHTDDGSPFLHRHVSWHGEPITWVRPAGNQIVVDDQTSTPAKRRK